MKNVLLAAGELVLTPFTACISGVRLWSSGFGQLTSAPSANASTMSAKLEAHEAQYSSILGEHSDTWWRTGRDSRGGSTSCISETHHDYRFDLSANRTLWGYEGHEWCNGHTWFTQAVVGWRVKHLSASVSAGVNAAVCTLHCHTHILQIHTTANTFPLNYFLFSCFYSI